MADWDDEDFDPDATEKVVPVVSDKWEGEDEEEEVLDNWDEDEKPKEQPKPAQPKDPSKKPGKKALAKRLKEIEEKERKLREEQIAETEAMTEDEKKAEKLRNQKLAEEADLQLAMETFGVTSDDLVGSSTIESMKCSTKEDFKTFEELLTSKISSFDSSPHYDGFLESLFVGLTTSLSAETARKISSAVTAIANEKTKIEKERAKKTKGKSKAKLAGAKKTGLGDNMVDYSTYNDFDDFM